MTDPITTSKTARESLARGLNALQADPTVPPQLAELAAPIAQAMGALHQIERTQQLSPHADVALGHVRGALSQLQLQNANHPAVNLAVEAVAASLGLVHSLSRLAAGAPGQGSTQQQAAQPQPPAPAPAAPQAYAQQPQQPPPQQAYAQPAPAPQQAYAQPAPAPQQAYAQPGPAPAPQQPYAQPAPAQPYAQPAPAPAPAPQQPYAQPAPAPQQAYAQPAPAPQQPPPQQAHAQQQAGPAAYGQAPQAQAPLVAARDPFAAPAPQPAGHPSTPSMPVPAPPAGNLQLINADLGAHSTTNFYKGLAGNDIIDHGGLFISTYRLPKINSPVRLKVSLPGGYEFEANAVVKWTRDDGGVDAPPGFGAQFTAITPEARQLVYRYVRNREPIFHDDF